MSGRSVYCIGCGRYWLPEQMEYVHTRSRRAPDGGPSGRCRQCKLSDGRAAYYRMTPEERRARAQERWKRRDPEKHRARQRDYYRRHLERERANSNRRKRAAQQDPVRAERLRERARAFYHRKKARRFAMTAAQAMGRHARE